MRKKFAISFHPLDILWLKIEFILLYGFDFFFTSLILMNMLVRFLMTPDEEKEWFHIYAHFLIAKWFFPAIHFHVDLFRLRIPYFFCLVSILINSHGDFVLVFFFVFLSKQMLNLCYVYYLSKLTEFADTIFFVLKKKKSQLTWLHLYHHSLTPLEAWILVKFLSGNFRGKINWIHLNVNC